jgi:hypothetical protein
MKPPSPTPIAILCPPSPSPALVAAACAWLAALDPRFSLVLSGAHRPEGGPLGRDLAVVAWHGEGPPKARLVAVFGCCADERLPGARMVDRGGVAVTPEQRAHARRIERGEEEPGPRRSSAPMPRPRLGGSLWRETPKGWVRVDGRTWPLRPLAVLQNELDAFDRLIPCRVPAMASPVRPGVVRRVWKAGALSALRVVASVASLERRAATYERDARVRKGAEFAARKSLELAAKQRERIATLPVLVSWGGRLVGMGAS